MALSGIRVLEFAGLAPSPFCGMILSDFGAKVTRIDRVNVANVLDVFSSGKQSIKLDLKHSEGKKIVHKLAKQSDVLIEPFRAGVMESLGLGPNVLLKENPRLVFARLTGYGQSGHLAQKAGHDINFLAMSGVLSCLGRHAQTPHPPVNLLADFAGGGLMAALGIVMALHERSRSNKGQVIDANMVDGSAYVGSFLWRSRHLPLWGNGGRGTNVLDGGVFYYDTYETLDGKYMAAGPLEEKFFVDFMKGLGLDPDTHDQQSDSRDKVRQIFRTKTRDEWTEIFRDLDACVTPVLDIHEAATDRGNDSLSFVHDDPHGNARPAPAPRLSRTPAMCDYRCNIEAGAHTAEVLRESGFTSQEIKVLLDSGVVQQENVSKL